MASTPTTTAELQNWIKEINSYELLEKGQERPYIFADIAKVQTSKDLYMIDTDVSGYKPLEEVGEMGNAEEDSVIQGYSFRYDIRNYRKQTTFSRNVMEGAQVGNAEDMVRDLLRAQRQTRENRVWSVLRNAFNPSNLGGDAKPLISVAGHSRRDGGPSQGNTFIDGVQRVPTYDNVMALLDVGYSIVTHSGNLMNAFTTGKKKILFGAPKWRERLYQIAGPRTSPELKKKPGTNENDINYIEERENFDVLIIDALQFEVARQLGETGSATKTSGNYWDTMWGVIDRDLAKKFFKVFVAPGYGKTAEQINLKNESVDKFVYDCYMYGFSNWPWILMSKGDGSVYAL